MKEFGLFVVVRVESCEGGRGERETDTENELLNGMRKKEEGCGTQRFMYVHECAGFVRPGVRTANDSQRVASY